MAKIDGGCGKAFEVKKGLHVKIINTHGSQVVDTWAFNINDMSEFLSTHHNRSCLEKLTPTVASSFTLLKVKNLISFYNLQEW